MEALRLKLRKAEEAMGFDVVGSDDESASPPPCGIADPAEVGQAVSAEDLLPLAFLLPRYESRTGHSDDQSGHRRHHDHHRRAFAWLEGLPVHHGLLGRRSGRCKRLNGLEVVEYRHVFFEVESLKGEGRDVLDPVHAEEFELVALEGEKPIVCEGVRATWNGVWEERIDLRVALGLDHRGVKGKEGVGREREAAETWPFHCKYDSRRLCRVHERILGWVTDNDEVAPVTDLAWLHPGSAAVVINVLEDLKDAFRLDLHEHLYRALSAVLLIWHVEVVMQTSPVFVGKD